MILDGAAMAATLFGEQLDPRAYLLRFYPALPVPPLDHVVLTAEPLIGRINHGHWIASCSCGARGVPSPGCAVFLDHLFGWCVRCQNGGSGQGWRPIVVPPLAERQAIEAVLLCRPHVENRNWSPGETVADLLSQNQEHGAPVPDVDDEPLRVAAALPRPRWPSVAAMVAVLKKAARRGAWQRRPQRKETI